MTIGWFAWVVYALFASFCPEAFAQVRQQSIALPVCNARCQKTGQADALKKIRAFAL
jgi:hypothetical protein